MLTWLAELKDTHGIQVVGDVPSGMPSPYNPVSDPPLLKEVFVDSIGIALIAYVISLSLARIMASKHRYQVRMKERPIYFKEYRYYND